MAIIANDAMPADMQVDFGQADFYLRDVRTRLHYLVCDFPFSNVGLAQVFHGEIAECVCEGLLAVFRYVGGVPWRIVFDNATGIGRWVCKEIRTSEIFGRFAVRFGFDYVFCNPNTGHEKGAVENKVGAIRRELFVPLPQVWNLRAFNEKLLARRLDKPHCAKGESERQLFCEDAFALLDLPTAEFKAMSLKRMRADKYGSIMLDGRRRYFSAPELGGAELIVGKGAFDVEIYDEQGTLVVIRERAWGEKPPETVEPASQLPLLYKKPAGWPNSRARDAARRSQGVDGCDGRGESQIRAAHHEGRRRRERLRSHGGRHEAGICARAVAGDRASVLLFASGICNGWDVVSYEEKVDFAAYDAAFSMAGGHMVPKAADRAAMESRIWEGARRLCLSNDTVGWLLERAVPRQLDAVAGLVDHELSVREANKKNCLLCKVAFPAVKSIDDFDFTDIKMPEGHDTADMRPLQWVESAQDDVFYGQAGRGKTHLAIALGMLCVGAGKTARYFSCAQLVLMLQKTQEGGRPDTAYADIAKADLVILDEFGYIPLDSKGAKLLFQIISMSYETRSLIVTTNRVFQMGSGACRRKARGCGGGQDNPSRPPDRVRR